MSLKKIHLLNEEIKKKIDNYINFLITEKNKDLYQDINNLKVILEQKEKEVANLKKDLIEIKNTNKKILNDISIIAHAINNLFFASPVYASYLDRKSVDDDDDEDTYH